MPETECYVIGPWRFSVSDGVLRSRDGERRLEDRAARTLAVLCRKRGEVVSQQEILDEVWGGRVVSGNSVAVVVSDLRRALDEDARAPNHVETVPKRGYRLRLPQRVDEATDEVTAQRGSARPPTLQTRRWAIGIGGAAALSIVAVEASQRGPNHLPIDVASTQNDTGRTDMDRLSRALSDLIELRLAAIPDAVLTKQRGLTKERGLPASGIEFRSRLILWNDQPTLSLQATSAASGEIVWTGMAEGPEPALAANTIAQLRRFASAARRLSRQA